MKFLLSILFTTSVTAAPISSLLKTSNIIENINSRSLNKSSVPILISEHLKNMNNEIHRGYDKKRTSIITELLTTSLIQQNSIFDYDYFLQYSDYATQLANLYKDSLKNVLIGDSNFYDSFQHQSQLNYQKSNEIFNSNLLKSKYKEYDSTLSGISLDILEIINQKNSSITNKLSNLNVEINKIELENFGYNEEISQNNILNTVILKAKNMLNHPLNLVNKYSSNVSSAKARMDSYYGSAKHYSSLAKWTGWFPGVALAYNNNFKNAINNTASSIESVIKIFQDENSEGGKILKEAFESLGNFKEKLASEVDDEGLFGKLTELVLNDIPGFEEKGFDAITSVVQSGITAGVAAIPYGIGVILNGIFDIINGIWNAYKMADIVDNQLSEKYDGIDAGISKINKTNIEFKKTIQDIMNNFQNKMEANNERSKFLKNKIIKNNEQLKILRNDLINVQNSKNKLDEISIYISNESSVANYIWRNESLFNVENLNKKIVDLNIVEKNLQKLGNLKIELKNLINSEVIGTESKLFMINSLEENHKILFDSLQDGITKLKNI